MGILSTMPDLRWSVVCTNPSKSFWWVYSFQTNGTVTWKDEFNGVGGSGTWRIQNNKLTTRWLGSTATESWNVPIDTTNWVGECTMKGEKYALQATARNYAVYSEVLPVGQVDTMACWAANLSWMSKIVEEKEKPQWTIVSESAGFVLENGSITKQGLMRIPLGGMFLRRTIIKADQLEKIVRNKPFPMLIGFSSGPLGGHCNTIHSFDIETNEVVVMEPWFPDPFNDSNYALLESTDGGAPLYVHKQTKEAFVFRGTHVKRPLSYYLSRPLSGEFIIAYSSKIKDPELP
jgi:hypothetical protein